MPTPHHALCRHPAPGHAGQLPLLLSLYLDGPQTQGASGSAFTTLGTSTSVTQQSGQGPAGGGVTKERRMGRGGGEARAQPSGKGSMCPPDSGFLSTNPGSATPAL